MSNSQKYFIISGEKVPKKLQAVFSSMKKRCLNKYSSDYSEYGGRGISIFKPWADNPQLFFDYCLYSCSMCWQPGLRIDRINNDGHYEPGNIRFVTNKENCQNKRRNKGKGYHWVKCGFYKSQIRFKKNQFLIGYYKTEIEARLAYLLAAEICDSTCNARQNQVINNQQEILTLTSKLTVDQHSNINKDINKIKIKIT